MEKTYCYTRRHCEFFNLNKTSFQLHSNGYVYSTWNKHSQIPALSDKNPHRLIKHQLNNPFGGDYVGNYSVSVLCYCAFFECGVP